MINKHKGLDAAVLRQEAHRVHKAVCKYNYSLCKWVYEGIQWDYRFL